MRALLILISAQATAEPIEVTTPDGRRVLLKDDQTWEFVEEEAESSESAEPEVPTKTMPLALLNRKNTITGCKFGLKLTNELGYEIRSLVPQFSAITVGGVVFQTVFQSFDHIKPTASKYREVEFRGLKCDAITELRVGGADRCSMGELDRFSKAKGVCLAHIRLLETSILPFTK